MKLSNPKVKYFKGRPHVLHKSNKFASGYERKYGEIKTCLQCKCQYFSYRPKTAKFCSLRCSNHGIYSPQWKGGRTTDKNGYILIKKPNHPDAWKSGYIYEHRIVMEQKLGRKLLKKERVHHKDGNPSNNNPPNLSLFKDQSSHMKACPRKNGRYAPENLS